MAFAMNALAAPIDYSEALKAARQYMQLHGKMLNVKQDAFRAPRKSAKAATTAASYYVFNNQGGGFVIVSGDDRTATILGYSDAGTVDANNMPENVANWLQSYSDQIAWLDDNDVKVDMKDVKAHDENVTVANSAAGPLRAQKARRAIAPKLASLWNQDSPYNEQCPQFYYNDGTTGQSVTGCVATAMAQVMYYHRYPTQTIAQIPSLTNRYSTSSGTLSVTLNAIESGTAIDWDNMTPTYGAGSTDAQKSAVARLMLLCGQAVNMNYGQSSGASSSLVAPALKNYFGYDEDTRLLKRQNYTIAQWNDLVYAELANDRPVLYTGQSTGGGHAFVIDGYDGEDLFHVNWGWGGYCNGYFALSVLNPGSNAGIGASSTNDGYSMDQDALFGAQAPDGMTAEAKVGLTSTQMGANGTSIYSDFWNYADGTYYFDFGFGFLNEDGSLGECRRLSSAYLDPYYGFQTATMDFSGLKDGTYRITPVSKLSSETEWQRCNPKSTFYALVVVSGGRYTITFPDEDINLEADISVDGLKLANSTNTINTVVRNNGAEYNGVVYLYSSMNQSEVGNVSYNSRGLTKAGCVLPANGSHTYSSDFTRSSAGTYYIWATTDADGKKVIGQTSVTITYGQLSGTASVTGMKAENQQYPTVTSGVRNVYGSRVKGVATLRNTDTANPLSTSLNVWLWTPIGGYQYQSSLLSTVTVNVPAGGEVEVPFDFTGVLNNTYYVQLYSGNNALNNTWAFGFTPVPGFIQYQSDGTSVAMAASSSITIDENTTAVDLQGVNGISSVTPNSNPNTLYFFDEGATIPYELSDANVVEGGTIATLNITDGNDFYTPVGFTATEVNYIRTPERYADGTNGWETLVVPFDVDNISFKDGREVDFFHSGTDDDKDFWIDEFAGIDDDNNVMFDYAESVRANTPYIVAFPGDRWGVQYSFKGKQVVFHGSDADITAGAKIVATTDAYAMRGQLASAAVGNCYQMNSDGNAFERTTSASVGAFRAYFVSKMAQSASPQVLRIKIGTGGESTGISLARTRQTDNDAWFTLQGVRLGSKPVAPGLYIHSGRKVMVK